MTLLAACGSSGGTSANNTGAGGATDTATTGATTGTTAGATNGTANGTPGSGATAAELQVATDQVTQWLQPLTADSFPQPAQLTKTPDIKGKTIYLVPLSDGIPVIHGIVNGVEQAITKAGGSYKLCDGGVGGQPNPTSWGTCLKTAGDQNAGAVMSFFIDYKAVATQFDALAKKGIPTLIGGVAGEGLTKQAGLIDVYDNSAEQDLNLQRLATLALATGGANTNVLWLVNQDSTSTSGSGAAGIAKFKELCPNCGIQSADFTTANSQAQLAATVSAQLVKNKDVNMVVVPTDSFTPLAIQGIQQAGKTGSVKFVSASGSLDAFQRIKAGQQPATTAIPSQFEGWGFANGLMQLLTGQQVAPVNQIATRAFNATNVGTLDLNKDKVLTDDWFTGGGQPYIDTFLKAWNLG